MTPSSGSLRRKRSALEIRQCNESGSCCRRGPDASLSRVFITGSADGLGRASAQTLLDDGHGVVVHVRNTGRLAAVRDLLDRGAAVVVGDLSNLEETRGIARDVNRLGRMDAVIHNAGVYTGPQVLPVNIVATAP